MEDFVERIRSGEFENKYEWVSKPIHPVLPRKPTAADAQKFADEMVTYEQAFKVYLTAQSKYRDGERDAYALFKTAVLEELGIIDHPKAELLFNKAWEHGHDSGYESVWRWAEDLAELIYWP